MPLAPGYTEIPAEWGNRSGWTVTTGLKSKRPAISPDKGGSAPTLIELIKQQEAVEAVTQWGYITTVNSSIVIIDVDAPKVTKDQKAAFEAEGLPLPRVEDQQDLPVQLKQWAKETYTERSASGRGWHIVFQLENTVESVKPATVHYVKAAAGWSGQLALSNNFMVTTGNRLASSPTTIATVSLSYLLDSGLFSTKRLTGALAKLQEAEGKAEQLDAILANSSRVSWSAIAEAFSNIPLDQSKPVVKAWEKLTGRQYEHYDFWMTMGMALHHEGQMQSCPIEALSLFITWSQSDPTAYTGDEDVAAHWDSFSTKPGYEQLTIRTALALYRLLVFDWPKSSKGVPDADCWDNVKYLMDYYDLMPMRLGSFYFVKGDPQIMEKYFSQVDNVNLLGYIGPFTREGLRIPILRLTQACGWKTKMSGIYSQVDMFTSSADSRNLITTWLDTPPDELPEELRTADLVDDKEAKERSTFDEFMSCIHLPDYPADSDVPTIAREQIYRTLMQLIKLADPLHAREDNGGMLGFIGPENTRKTTFFKELLPAYLSRLSYHWITPLQGEKSMRDFSRSLTTHSVVLLDEFDAYLKDGQAGAMFKSIVTTNMVQYTEIYSTAVTEAVRTAVLVGTSNEMALRISDTGSRRLWFVEVKFIDTDRLRRISRYWLFKNMQVEYRAALDRGERPWLMSNDMADRITNHNRAFTAESSSRLELHDLFPFTAKRKPATIAEIKALVSVKNPDAPDHPHLYTTKQIQTLLNATASTRYNRAELQRALENHSIAFLGGLRGTQMIPGIYEGKAYTLVNGKLYYSTGRQYKWLLPPLYLEGDEK